MSIKPCTVLNFTGTTLLLGNKKEGLGGEQGKGLPLSSYVE
jgi:hypothetical protein